MKDRLVSHLNMVFTALSIESASEVYDCTFDKLPDWACHLSHSYRYFVCTSAVDKLDILKKFLGKDIYVLGDMLYWYDGDAIETIEPIAIITNTAQHTHSIVETQLKSSTRLPSWLDDFIFKTLHAEYAPNHERFDYNLDLSETDIRKYLGTYFPRSYAESFCIFDNLFRNVGYAGEFLSDSPINIAVIGCGTGGDLMGLLTVISKYSALNRKINITAVDGNKDALDVLFQIVERYKQYYRKDLSLKVIHHTFSDISSFSIDSVGTKHSFDFVLCAKMICEIIASGNGSNDNAYYDFVKQFLPLINSRGVFYLLDVTTRQKHSTFNPFLMNEQVQNVMVEYTDYCILSPIPCSLFNSTCKNSCFYQKTFTITHSHVREDKSKVAYKLIVSRYLSQKIGHSPDGKGKYRIHGDKLCPHTESWEGSFLDAFYIPEKQLKCSFQKLDVSINTTTPEKPEVTQADLSHADLIYAEDILETEAIEHTSEEECYYAGCYIIDTNVFIEKPDIIETIPEDYFVVLSAKVLEELDHLKIKKNISVAGKKRANRALKNISDSLSRKDREIIMEDSDVRLLPKDFDKHNPDNKILSVALKFVGENPILLTSDFGLQARAKAMGVESISLKEYKKINNN